MTQGQSQRPSFAGCALDFWRGWVAGGLEGDFARLGDVQASGDSERCLEWLHSPGTPKCHCQPLQPWGGGPKGLGVAVLPPLKQTGTGLF